MKQFITKNLDLIVPLALLPIYMAVLKFGFGIEPSAIESISVPLFIINVNLVRRQNSWGFVVGLIMGVFFLMHFASVGLYGQVALRLFVMASQVLSIWFWRKPKDKRARELRPSFLSSNQRILWIVGLAVIAAAASFDGLISVLDYATMYLVMTGVMLLARKKTEAWGGFLAADAMGAPLFILSSSYMMLYVVVFSAINNVTALFQWRKDRAVKK